MKLFTQKKEKETSLQTVLQYFHIFQEHKKGTINIDDLITNHPNFLGWGIVVKMIQRPSNHSNENNIFLIGNRTALHIKITLITTNTCSLTGDAHQAGRKGDYKHVQQQNLHPSYYNCICMDVQSMYVSPCGVYALTFVCIYDACNACVSMHLYMYLCS